VRFALEEFDAVLAIRDAENRPFLLIGGQAVYFWGSRYVAQEPGLEQWRPFTSKDIDFQGGRDDVIRTAKRLGVTALLPDKREMTSLAGIVPCKIRGQPTSIEFVRTSPGINPEEADRSAAEYEVLGRRVRVLDPVSLLSCKLHLALKVNQKERRDVDHLQIMLLCVRAFLRETLSGAEAEAMPARGWLGAVERVLHLSESALGKKAIRDLDVDWSQALPLAEIGSSVLPLATALRERRLPQWRKAMR
jgi:hypothetical protein